MTKRRRKTERAPLIQLTPEAQYSLITLLWIVVFFACVSLAYVVVLRTP